MTVDWNGYEPYIPPFRGPLHDLPAKQARQAFEHLMIAKPERIDSIRRLLSANGVDLTSRDSAIQQLNDWLRANVESSPEEVGRLRNIWYSVVNDIALFLGDAMIERYPALRWELFTSAKKDVAYQRHVLVGFTKAPNPRFNVDIDRLVATFAHQVVSSTSVTKDYFLTVINAAGKKV